MTLLFPRNTRRWIPLLRRNTGKLKLFIFLFALMIGASIVTKTRICLDKTCPLFFHTSQHNLLDGCRYIYLDLGTNIGIQIRKLYEPHLYPNASVLPLFEQIFGNHSNEVCSVGFEANPVHDRYLKEFENYCLQRNWRVKIFTSTAVSIVEKNLTFYVEPQNKIHNEWGASLKRRARHTRSVTVPSIDIISWFRTTVFNRKISPEFPMSRIMMKTDIENHDSVVISNLILSGLYCSIDLIYGEHLDSNFRNATSLLQGSSNTCKTQLIDMDDESYHRSKFPFIIHNSTG